MDGQSGFYKINLCANAQRHPSGAEANVLRARLSVFIRVPSNLFPRCDKTESFTYISISSLIGSPA